MSEPLPTTGSKMPPADLSLAIGGLSAGLLATTCCILPLVFALAGVSGAWIGNLTAMSPYQPIFITIAALSISLGVWHLRRSRVQCVPGSLCANPVYRRSTRTILLAGSFLTASAVAVDIFGRLVL